ncbi:MAG: hypothetical protein CFH08_02061 [Alphaproteobacteria bacterium MarineAlpha3_Bin7]|nr:MAG: hypothetical protein CFH08_02061 [Alphaproteobacteria bacterium MarineAlpha3_Bin7]
MIADIGQAFSNVLSFGPMLAIFCGVSGGLIIGAIPGLSVTMAMALLAPITFFMEPLIGISFLIGLFKGGTYGGSISSILIGTPGTAANAATILDGYEMAKRGKAGKAILGGLYASLIGDFAGSIALVFGAPLLALIALRFGFPEYFALILFSLTMVCFISGNSLSKGIFSAAIGLFLGLIGSDPIGGVPRLTFGISELQSGISVVPLAIGLFALSEVLVRAETLKSEKFRYMGNEALGIVQLKFTEIITNLKTILRSSAVGTLIGALPGIGSETSSWVAYGLAKRASKTPDEFGKGKLEGVLAPEAANNAVCGSAMIPMLVFGIPGDVVTVLLMSALIAQGLNPGPSLIEDNQTLFFGLFISVFVATCFLFLIGRLSLKLWVRLLNIPPALLYGVVVVLCIVGTYGINSDYFDLIVMVCAGVLGYIMRRLDIGLPPLILTFVLSTLLENSFRRGMIQADGNIFFFLERPIAVVFVILTLFVLISTAYRTIKNQKNYRDKTFDN